MGSCGCGDFDGVRWAVGVGENILAVSEYDGCNNGCNAPLGFTVHLMNPEGAARWGVEETGEWVPDKWGEDQRFLNFFSQGDLARAAREMEQERGSLELGEYESLGDLLDEIGLELMRRAWDLRQKEEARLRKRFGEKPPFGPARASEGQEGDR